MPTVNVDATNKHLAEITKGVAAEAIAVLVIDGAGWYRSSTLIVLDNIVLLTLPPIGPILSVPSEHVNGQRSEIRRVGITASQAAAWGVRFWRARTTDRVTVTGAQPSELGGAERPQLRSPPGPAYARLGSRAAVGPLTKSTAALGGFLPVSLRPAKANTGHSPYGETGPRAACPLSGT